MTFDFEVSFSTQPPTFKDTSFCNKRLVLLLSVYFKSSSRFITPQSWHQNITMIGNPVRKQCYNETRTCLITNLVSDVSFTCGESRRIFHAHKYVLATSSAVFFAMFYG